MEGTVCMILLYYNNRHSITGGLLEWLRDTSEDNGLGYVFWTLFGLLLLGVAIHGIREYRKNRKEIDSVVGVREKSAKRNINGSEIGDIVVFYDRSIIKVFDWISFGFLIMFVIFTVFDVVYSVENARENSYVMFVIFSIVQMVKFKYKLYTVSWVGEEITVHRFLKGNKVYNISDIDSESRTDSKYRTVVYVNGKKAFKINMLSVNSEMFNRKLEAYGKVIKSRGER